MPTTPGHTDLPAVTAELAVLSGHFPPPQAALHLVGPHATRRAVLDALPDHSWVHFACHGGQHSTDPSRSAVALWDGALTVADLTEGVSVDRAQLAFLSACQTATGSIRLLDEAIHLAAAAQLLGYRHVLATLWTIEDAPAPRVAETVYGYLSHGGRLDGAEAATALHHAVQALRRERPDQPLVWAPYIHTGP